MYTRPEETPYFSEIGRLEALDRGWSSELPEEDFQRFQDIQSANLHPMGLAASCVSAVLYLMSSRGRYVRKVSLDIVEKDHFFLCIWMEDPEKFGGEPRSFRVDMGENPEAVARKVLSFY